MAGAEIEADASDERSVIIEGDLRFGETDDGDVLALDRELLGHDRRPARRERRHELALRAQYSLERADQLEVGRAHVRHEADFRAGDLARLRDLADAAHRDLED